MTSHAGSPASEVHDGSRIGDDNQNGGSDHGQRQRLRGRHPWVAAEREQERGEGERADQPAKYTHQVHARTDGCGHHPDSADDGEHHKALEAAGPTADDHPVQERDKYRRGRKQHRERTGRKPEQPFELGTNTDPDQRTE